MLALKQTDVAIVANRPDDQQLLVRLLANAGYQAGTFEHGGALENCDTPPMAAIVCHRQSEQQPFPVVPKLDGGQRLVVLSDCVAEQAVVNSLENGAHHYFNITEAPRVIQERLAAALRQHARAARRLLEVGPFRFDTARRAVRIHDKLVELSPKEYELAHYLFAHCEQVVTIRELMTTVWSLPASMDTRRIDTAACRVRKKLMLDETTGWRLRRVRRIGYELQPIEGCIEQQSGATNNAPVSAQPVAPADAASLPVLTNRVLAGERPAVLPEI